MLGIFRYIFEPTGRKPPTSHRHFCGNCASRAKPWARQSCNHVTTEISRSKYRRRHSSGRPAVERDNFQRHTPGKTWVGESSNIHTCILYIVIWVKHTDIHTQIDIYIYVCLHPCKHDYVPPTGKRGRSFSHRIRGLTGILGFL